MNATIETIPNSALPDDAVLWCPHSLHEILAANWAITPEVREKLRRHLDRLDGMEPLMFDGTFSPEFHHLVDDDRDEDTHPRTLEALGRMRVSGTADEQLRRYAGAICQRYLDDETAVEYLRAIPG